MKIKTIEVCCTFYYRGWVYCCNWSVDEKFSPEAWFQARPLCCFVITSVSFILVRIILFMHTLRTLMLGILGYELCRIPSWQN